MREEEINLFLDNIYKNQKDGLLTEFDKKIVNIPSFEYVVKNREFQNLEELKLFFEQVRNVFNMCQKNDINEDSLFPIDPNTGKDIDINNFYINNGICYNSAKKIKNSEKKSDMWKKLFFTMSLQLLFNNYDYNPNFLMSTYIYKILDNFF